MVCWTARSQALVQISTVAFSNVRPSWSPCWDGPAFLKFSKILSWSRPYSRRYKLRYAFRMTMYFEPHGRCSEESEDKVWNLWRVSPMPGPCLLAGASWVSKKLGKQLLFGGLRSPYNHALRLWDITDIIRSHLEQLKAVHVPCWINKICSYLFPWDILPPHETFYLL